MHSLIDYKLIDIHYHANPDLYLRRWDAFEAGKKYQALNGAVILKSHLGATSIQASLAQKAGLPVLPSLVLNHIAGGIDYKVVISALSEYQPVIAAKIIVHFPTITGRTIKSRLSRQLIHPHLKDHTMSSETIFDSHNRLKDKVIDILKMGNDYPVVLSTGHASKEEIYELTNACIQYNVKSLLLNQPANPLTGLNANELLELSRNEFIWIEQTALTYLLKHQTKEDFLQVLTSIPRVLYSSDLGQTDQLDVNNWIDFSEQFFTDASISLQRKRELFCDNAIKLLAI